MDIVFLSIIQAITLLCIIGVFCYYDIKFREIPMKTVKWLPIFYAVSLAIFYGCFMLCTIHTLVIDANFLVVIPIITAAILPFLLWFFAKGKIGAIDSRIMMMTMLTVPNLYFQMFFVILLAVVTLIMFIVTKYLTKSYDKTTTDGEQRYIPQMVSLGIATLIMFLIWFIF